MATDLERLVVQLSVDFKGMERQLARANQTTVGQLNKLQRDAQRSARGIEGAFSGIGAGISNQLKGLIGIFSFVEIISKTREAIHAMGELGDAAERLGVSAVDIQKLGFALSQNGGNAADAADDLDQFSKRIGEASRGSGDLFKVLEANGVALRDQQGNVRPLAELFLEYANLVKNASSQQEKAALTAIGFGRSAKELVGTLQLGAQGFTDVGNAAAASGQIIDEQGIKKMKELDDQIKALMSRAWVEFEQGVIDIVTLFERANVSIDKFIDRLGFIGEAFRKIDKFTREFGPFSQQSQEGFFGLFGTPSAASGASRSVTGKVKTKAVPEDTGKPTTLPSTAPAPTGLKGAALSLQQLDEQIRGIENQTLAIGKSEGALLALNAKQKIQNDLIRENIQLTPAQIATQDVLLRQLEEEANKLDVLQHSQQRAAEVTAAAQDAFRGIIDDMAHGASAADALTHALSKLVDKLLDIAVQTLFSGLGGESKGIGSLIAKLFHQGGVVGQGGSSRQVSAAAFLGARRMHAGGLAGNEVPAILKKGEIVFPANMPRTSRGGQNITVNANFDARGADASSLPALRAEFERFKREMPKTIRGTVQHEKNQNPGFIR